MNAQHFSTLPELSLLRWPEVSNNSLQAWNAADELVLSHVLERDLDTRSVLVVNDAFGALSCALHPLPCVNWSDSWTAQQAARSNFNRLFPTSALTTLKSTEALTGTFDLVIIKIPKTISLLDYQLKKIRPHLAADARVIGAAMLKHLPRAAFASFEKNIGPVSTSLAVKKARLLFSECDRQLPVDETDDWVTYTDPDIGFPLDNRPGIFSREKLDHGTRLLLKQFKAMPAADRVLDLACGNGVLGIQYQLAHPDSELLFTDESYLAIESASHNYNHVIGQGSKQAAQFLAADGLGDCPDNSVDLILCNPPFHQEQVMGRGIALRFFRQSKSALRKGGQLWIVANRHLDYQTLLKSEFGNCSTIASNKRFIVLRTTKR